MPWRPVRTWLQVASGSEVRNLITIQHNPANNPVMRGFENEIRSVVERGYIFKGSFTPIYKGDGLVPIGISIEGAASNGYRVNVSILNYLN